MDLELHNEETVKHKVFDATNILSNLKRISYPRGSLLGGLSLIIFGIFTNQFNEGPGHQAWDWEQVSFLVIMLAGLFIILAVSEHFLESHLWGHVVKKHFLKILLWTFGALLLIELFKSQINIDNWVKSNQLIILFLAVIIGIIPESGPHLVFVTLYINHAIPFSILLASSIVQDGHASLPLLAESKKGFFIAKGINILIGLLVGLAGMYIFEN
jgi:MFS family permease